MANPFNLRGPEFLVFFAVFGVTVNLIMRLLIRLGENKETPRHWDYTDPYKIAYLRAGISEALRVTIFSLIDRGLLKASGDHVKSEPRADEFAQRPIEKTVVRLFDNPRAAKEVFSDSSTKGVDETYRKTLAGEGLMAGSETYAQRKTVALTAIGLIVGVATIKIMVAISRGRSNICFLVLMTLGFVIWAIVTWRRARTRAGDEMIKEMKLRFHSLKLRAPKLRPGGMTNEAAFLAAVFGLSVLSSHYFPYVKVLFPKATSSSSGDYSGGCGGGGCSGGGCGGGCGGCGG